MQNLKRNFDIVFLAILINFMPYTLLGEEFSETIILFLGIGYLLLKKYVVFFDWYVILLMIMCILGFISVRQSNNIFLSLEGVCVYLSAIVFYYIFYNLRDKKEEVYDWFVYTFLIGTIVCILYQGIIINVRIHGNIGYANTYAILIIVALYVNLIRKNQKIKNIAEYILMLGLLYTQSRISIILFVIFAISNIFIKEKEKVNRKIFMKFSLAILSYLFISYGGIMAIMFIPPSIYISYCISNYCKYKVKKILSFILGIWILRVIGFSKINLFLRIRNIGFNAPVFQERLVFYSDAIKAILYNPLGFGINTFQYKQYSIQSAFYDVKYIHNAILQVMFDMGILAGIVFLMLFIYGIITICKNGKKDKKIYLLLMYTSIYFHGMFEFDFSFVVIFIVLSMILGLTKNEKNIKYIEKKYILNAVWGLSLLVSIYFIMINTFKVAGGTYQKHKDIKCANKMYNLYKKWTFNINSDAYMLLAETSLGSQERIYLLQKSRELNPYDPKIAGNIAFTYEKMSKPYEAIIYYEEFFKKQKFYNEMYSIYFKFLRDFYFKTGDKFFEVKRLSLENMYYENFKLLNKRARFMKDQLLGEFEEVLK